MKSYYSTLMGGGIASEKYWKVTVPPRVAFFSWCVTLGRVLTEDNLRKRGIMVTEWCFMCKNYGDDVNHLFLHCAMASDLWAMVYTLFGVFWVMPLSVRERIEDWKGCFGMWGNGTVWRRVVPLCLMWRIWHEHNAQCFEDKEISMVKLKYIFLNSLHEWTPSPTQFSVEGFLDDLTFLSFS